tara:strand:- start:24 stop:218 length:195 start_codon:yes stop_codon:yes gene_type:complete
LAIGQICGSACVKKQKYDYVMCGDCQIGFTGLSVVSGGSTDRNKNDAVVVYVMVSQDICATTKH